MHQTTLYFSTYTNLNWINVLECEAHKQIILDSLHFLVSNGRIILYGFVIMPNHIHLIWKISEEHLLKDVQRDFLKYTAQQIRFRLIATGDPLLDSLVVYAKDRNVQVWERNGYSFMLNNHDTIIQKLNYIHRNPLQKKWKLSESPEGYYYSSAKFYKTGHDDFGFLTPISEA